MKNLLLTLLVGFSFIFFACTKQNVITDASAALTLKTDTLTFSTSTFVDADGNDQTETLSGVTYFYFNFDHNLGKKPSITVTEAGSPDVKAFVPVKYINDNRVRVYFTGKTNGKVYAN